MENTSRLYDTLVGALSQHQNWLDVRHLKTLAWMMVGLLQSEKIGLTHWIPFVQGRAKLAQSTQRRFTRWLHNSRIQVNDLYGPLIEQALAEWGREPLYLALDTSMLWGEYCIIRLSIVYRGRAVPLIWKVIEHASSSVAFSEYQPLLDEANKLLPLYRRCDVVFLADRGFADTELMRHLSDELGWHRRIRIKTNFKVHRRGHAVCKISRMAPPPGQAHFLHHVYITDERLGPVHLALAHHQRSQERWYVVSDQPTTLDTFDDYGLRFDIEENFLDDKSNGFQLESSLIRSADALNRLCFILAVTTLYLVSQGIVVVAENMRRSVDPHWYRGNSYLKIGWQWVKHALVKGWQLIQCMALSSLPDPEPSIASKKQWRNLPPLRFAVSFRNYA
ncbi:hypothetical protein LCGC14_1960530 [marine sediment metagenome]|uniref:Transposase IS4-like domain-containing protein n=1 Tax=marine sediment metagenome TaxID=412755 RepID=A0A0F9FEZ5_9ZZZZ